MSNDKQFLVDMGMRISKRRKELKLTQEQLAERINLSLQSISCIELGKKAIRPYNLVRLCETLEISADYILTGKKSGRELGGIVKKTAMLCEDDLVMVEALIDHLNKK